jgi:hypothetical protein
VSVIFCCFYCFFFVKLYRLFAQSVIRLQISMKVWWTWLLKFTEMLPRWRNVSISLLSKSGLMGTICINVRGKVTYPIYLFTITIFVWNFHWWSLFSSMKIEVKNLFLRYFAVCKHVLLLLGRCQDYVKAWKRLTVKCAPNILTIALKRFQVWLIWSIDCLA